MTNKPVPYRIKPLTRLGWWASGLVGMAGLTAVLSAVVFGYLLYIVHQAGLQYAFKNWGAIHPAFSFAWMLVGIFAVVFLFLFIVGFIVYMFWLYRAAANVHALRHDAMSISPGWAVGWNFVPIAFFWMPYVAVKQIWQASSNIQYPDQVPVPGMLRWWWGFWLIAAILNWSREFDLYWWGSMDIPKGDLIHLIAFYAAIAAACLFLFRIIREITRAQATLASNTAGIFE